MCRESGVLKTFLPNLDWSFCGYFPSRTWTFSILQMQNYFWFRKLMARRVRERDIRSRWENRKWIVVHHGDSTALDCGRESMASSRSFFRL